jgi:hypothetical protein
MYAAHPVGFGGNVNGALAGIDFPPYIKGGYLLAAKPSDFACLLYQFVSGPIPSSLNSVITPTVKVLQFAQRSAFYWYLTAMENSWYMICIQDSRSIGDPMSLLIVSSVRQMAVP